MAQLNLSNWEIIDDVTNSKIVIRSKQTGESLELTESGSFTASSGVDGTNVTPNDITVNAGNGIAGGGTVSLGGSFSVDITENGIQLTEIDESIAPTWTGSHDFTGGGIVVPEPTNSTDAATKGFVESVAQGLTVKEPVRVSNHDVNIDLTSSTDPNPIDGITLNDGDRILLKHQTTLSENGIYDAVTATDPTTWVRSSDFDEDSEVVQGAFVFVRGGTHANESYVVTTPDPITVGTDDIEFSEFSAQTNIEGGTNITRDGSKINLDPSIDLTGNVGVSGEIQDGNDNTMLNSVADTGQVTLSNNLAEVSTNISATDATFMLALGIDDPDADAEVAGSLYWDDSAGNYEIRIRELETNLNPTVNFDIIRVR